MYCDILATWILGSYSSIYAHDMHKMVYIFKSQFFFKRIAPNTATCNLYCLKNCLLMGSILPVLANGMLHNQNSNTFLFATKECSIHEIIKFYTVFPKTKFDEFFRSVEIKLLLERKIVITENSRCQARKKPNYET